MLSGKPTRAGNFNISVTVTDGLGNGDGTIFPITITGPPLSVITTTLPNGTVGVAYSTVVQATGGATPYVFSISAGSLPVGSHCRGCLELYRPGDRRANSTE